MARHNEIGKIGEEIASRYLLSKGYVILERDWRLGHMDVDIIAEKDRHLFFVEVKTRTSESFLSAVDAVDMTKRKNIIMAARAYVNYRKFNFPVQFDIITVVGDVMGDYSVTHYEDAFSVPYRPSRVRWH